MSKAIQAPAKPTIEELILRAIRQAERPLTLEELREATGRPVTKVDCILMFEDEQLRPTDWFHSAYYIPGEESDLNVY